MNTAQKFKAWLVAHKTLAIFIAAVLVVGIILAIVLPLTVGNIFRAANIAKINLGDDYAQVEKILGKPNVEKATTYGYYSNNIVKKMQQLANLENNIADLLMSDKEIDENTLENLLNKAAELAAEIETMEYKQITVEFSDGKVTQVIFDKYVNGDAKEMSSREIKKIVLGKDDNVDIADAASGNVACRTYLEDGSYHLTALPSNAQSDGYTKSFAGSSNSRGREFTAYSHKITWTDAYGEHNQKVEFTNNANMGWNISGNSLNIYGDMTLKLYTFFMQDGYPWNSSDYQFTSINLYSYTLPIDIESLLSANKVQSLENVVVGTDNPNYSTLRGILLNKEQTEIIYAPKQNKNLAIVQAEIDPDFTGLIYVNNVLYGYKGSMPANYNLVIEDGTVEIVNGAFRDCVNLKSVTIPDSVTKIGSSAFSGCSNLENVTISSGVTEISSSAFYGCSKLRSVTIPDSVTKIGSSAFSGCTNLESVTIPDSVTKIDGNAFNGCSNLKDVILSDNLVEIGNFVFNNCSNLNYNVYGNANYLGTTSNPYLLLISATSQNITSCEISDSCKFIAGHAFYECTKLTSVTISNSVIFIGTSTFYGCSKLTNVTFDNPNGWSVASIVTKELSATDLSNTATAAQYLTEKYWLDAWSRTEA